MKATPWLLSLALALCVGCRSDDNGDGDGDGDGNGNADAGPGEDVTIQQVQSDDMTVGTPVTLRGVVVVAIDGYGGRTGGLHVQEPEGGAFSGVLVYVPGSAAADLVPGDLVDIEGGVKDEFALQEDETGRTLTEVSPAEGSSITITKVGEGTVPAPEVLNPWELAASDDEAEKWEGVLVTFENVRVLSRPRKVSSTDETLTEMSVTGPFAVSSSLTALSSETISSGDCYQSITGIGDYFFSYKILPRNQGDLVGAGDGCLPEETTADLCGDGTDNDYNGFKDCSDYSCDAPTGDETLCEIASSVVEIQNETFDQESGVAVLSDVTITAVSEYNFWIQDTDAAGEYNGVQAYRGDLGALTVGQRYDLKGRAIEYGTVTELTSVTLGANMPGGNGADVSTVTLAQVTGADAEKWEGVLVTVENVSVSTPANDGSFGQFVVTDGTDSLYIDDGIFADAEMGAEMNDCYDITGVMHFNISDDHVTLLPRDAGDLAASAGC